MIILIGASSFIGVHTVAELLKQGCKVVVTGRNNKFKEHYDKLGVEYINLDLNNKDDYGKLPSDNVEGVILLAGLLPANAEVNLDTDENAAVAEDATAVEEPEEPVENVSQPIVVVKRNQ